MYPGYSEILELYGNGFYPRTFLELLYIGVSNDNIGIMRSLECSFHTISRPMRFGCYEMYLLEFGLVT